MYVELMNSYFLVEAIHKYPLFTITYRPVHLHLTQVFHPPFHNIKANLTSSGVLDCN